MIREQLKHGIATPEQCNIKYTDNTLIVEEEREHLVILIKEHEENEDCGRTITDQTSKKYQENDCEHLEETETVAATDRIRIEVFETNVESRVDCKTLKS